MVTFRHFLLEALHVWEPSRSSISD